MKNLVFATRLAVLATLIITIYRVMIMGLSTGEDEFYIVRQVAYTAAWGAIAYFLIAYLDSCICRGSYFVHCKKAFKVKIISIIAVIACLIKTIFVVMYNFPLKGNLFMMGYDLVETVVWFVLTIFFAFFARYMQKRIERLEREEEEE